MASYGGYTRTGYGAQGGEDGGGFMGASQQGSQGGASRSHAEDSLRPVTIKQLIDCREAYPGAELTIDDCPVTQVTIVGQVRSVNPQTTNITYKIDDGTAVIDVKKWIDAEKADDSDPKFPLETYVRVWGRISTFNGKKHINGHYMRAVEDFNEVNYHLLEATYVHLCSVKGGPPGQRQGDGAATGGDAMFVDSGGEMSGGAPHVKLSLCSRNAKNMFNFLANSPAAGNEGMHVNLIASSTGMSVEDVQAASEELMSHGMLYTTVDDETWAILDY
ncbi:Replication factor A protein 2 [Madurella fahalii]|uniref:Replication factor A protein 2 n=1 Tax=Madurella fahalii TaxID=1157608 RepID=A0ABQ0GMM8_9PEZI